MKKVPVLVIAGLLMLGCRANEDSLPHFIAQAHSQARAQVAPLAELAPFVADEFVMASPRVPFVHPLPEQAAPGPERDLTCWQPDPTRRRGALERFSLAQLSMKGVMGDTRRLWALIYTPDGRLVKLGEGDYLGFNQGRVRKVKAKQVEIEEVLPDGTGCWLKRPAALMLAAAELAG